MADTGMPLGEALVGKNCSGGLDAAYSNAAVFAHQLGMAASPYAVQVSIDEAMGAKAGGPIAVGAMADQPQQPTPQETALQKMADTGAAAAFEEGHDPEHPLLVPAARAYVTLLARGRAGYSDFQELGPVVRLANALREARAAYPLIVAVPPDAPDDLRRRLAREGCIVREVHPLMYDQPGHFAVGSYGHDDMNYHSELRIVHFPEYERVVCLDAARIQALENMDDLFELDKGFLYAWVESSAGDKDWSRAPWYKIAYSNEQSPDTVAWRAIDAEVAALLSNAAVLVYEPSMPFGGVLLGKNHAAEQGALYCNAAGFAPRAHVMPFGEALLGKNLSTELGAPFANATMSARDPGMPLGEALVGKNCSAGLDTPYSNAAVFAHQLGMAAGEALRATPASPYAVQVSIDEAMGAKADGPIAVGAMAAGADARDARGRGGNLSAVVGLVAASSAVTAIVAGAVSPVVAFGFFVVLLGGLSLAMSTVRGA